MALAPKASGVRSIIFGDACQDISLQTFWGLRCGLFPRFMHSIEAPGYLLYLSGLTVPYEVPYVGYNGMAKWPSNDEANGSFYGDGSRTALHAAAFRGHISEVQKLLGENADLERCDSRGWTPLHAAASGGYEMVVKLLLKRGANPSAQDKEQRTALHEAASEGHDAVSQTLLEYGADHSSQDSKGRTPLHLAAYGGHFAVVQRLLGNGADFSCQDCNRKTALQLAESKGHEEVFRALREKSVQGQRVSSSEWSSWESLRPRTQYPLSGAPLPRKLCCPFPNGDKSSTNIVIAGSTAEDLVQEDEEGGECDEGEAGGNEKTPDTSEEENYDDELSSNYASHREDAEYIEVCAAGRKGKGKRMVDMSDMVQRGLEHQDPPTKRVKKDCQGSGQGVEGKEKQTDRFSTHMPSEDRSLSYGCPYFKSNAQEYRDCMDWKNLGIDKVREHCRRVHLKPLQCLNCGSYRAGDNGEMSEHHLFESCQRAAKITPINNDVVEKGQSLEKRDLNWKQIYKILFPKCPTKNIPSPYWKDLVEVPTNHSLNEVSAPPLGHTSTAKKMNEELGHFSDYIQGQCPRLLHEFQTQRGFGSPKQSSPLTFSEDEGPYTRNANVINSCLSIEATTNNTRTFGLCSGLP